jgi:nitroreductase
MFYELLKSRRSVRKFESREVEREKVDIILKSALLAPSSRARRPWEFISVTDRGLLQKLSECREHGSGFLAGAPLGIVVAADPEACDVWVEDTSIASTIIQLSAQSLGLSSCWIQVRERLHPGGAPAEDHIRGVLGIPAGHRVECMIGIGYAAEEKKPYDDGELLYGKIHWNRF